MKKYTASAVLTAVSLLLSGCGFIGGILGGTASPTDTTTDDPALSSMTQCLTDAADSVTPGSSSTTSGTIQPSKGFKSGAQIGISLPQKTSQNWVEAEAMFTTSLKSHGFKPTVTYATGGIEEQQKQVADMVTKGVSVLVVGAIDGSTLDKQLKAAKTKGITVIAYDRLLTQTEYVDMYIAFDNYKIGQLQAQGVIQGMLDTHGQPPFNIELIAGSPDDNNSTPFFNGAMSVLQPGIDCGALVVLSGQTTQTQAATQGWLSSNAQQRMDSILSNYYTDAKLHGVLSPNDTLARAAYASLTNAGMADEHTILSGQDSESESIRLIMQGTQHMTIYKSTQVLVAEIVRTIGYLQAGEAVAINDTNSYNNGVKDVPTLLLTPQVVTKENAAQVYADDPLRAGCTEDPPRDCQR